MPRFVRVANRHGWKIEAVGSAGAVESKTLGSRDEALAYAASLEPHWIEIGDSGFVKEHVDQRLSEVRVREAVGTGAEMLAVCCPFEVSLFEDTVKSTGNDGRLIVHDIIELLDESLTST
ncbi:MAG: hypothetical protein WB682_06185 [Candidatus Dormiibacterota bacterium]